MANRKMPKKVEEVFDEPKVEKKVEESFDVRVNYARVNIREAPTMKSKVHKIVLEGTILHVSPFDDKWYVTKLSLENGKVVNAYIVKELVKKV